MFEIILVIFCIFEQTPYLLSSPVTGDPATVTAESDIRETANTLFYSLGLRKIQEQPRLHQYALAYNYFISLTLQDYIKLKEIIKLTRVDKGNKGNGATDLIALINEILNEDSVLKLQSIILGEDTRTRYDITGEMEKLKHLQKYYHEQEYNRSTERNKDILERLQQEESLELPNITTINKHNDSNAEIQFWDEDDALLVERRIFKGKKTKIKQFPFMASVQIFGKFQCGGSIIQSDLVITAASCLQLAWNNRFYRENPEFLSVRVGSSFYEIGGESIDVLEVYFHPSYHPKLLYHNLAIMRLVRKINVKKKKVKKIQIGGEITQNSGKILTLGWGATTKSNTLHIPSEDMLRHADLDLYALRDCQDVYSKEYVTDLNFCGGFISLGTGACNRDVGGPGVIAGRLVGIISFGTPICGSLDTPTVFTKLNPYIDWIEEIMEQRVAWLIQRTTLKPPTFVYEPPQTSHDALRITPLLPRHLANSFHTVAPPVKGMPITLNKKKKLRDRTANNKYNNANIKIYKNEAKLEPEISLQQESPKVTEMVVELMRTSDGENYDQIEDANQHPSTVINYKEKPELLSDSEAFNYNFDQDDSKTMRHQKNKTHKNLMYPHINAPIESQKETTPVYHQTPTNISSKIRHRQNSKYPEILSKYQEDAIRTNHKNNPEKLEELNYAFSEFSTEAEEKSDLASRSEFNNTYFTYSPTFQITIQNELMRKNQDENKLVDSETFSESHGVTKLEYPIIVTRIQQIEEPYLTKSRDQVEGKVNYPELPTQVQESEKWAYKELLEYQKHLAQNHGGEKLNNFELPTQDQNEAHLDKQESFEQLQLTDQNLPTQHQISAKSVDENFLDQQTEDARFDDYVYSTQARSHRESSISIQEEEEETPKFVNYDIPTLNQEEARNEADEVLTQGLERTKLDNGERLTQEQEGARLDHEIRYSTFDQKRKNFDQQDPVNVQEEARFITKGRQSQTRIMEKFTNQKGHKESANQDQKKTELDQEIFFSKALDEEVKLDSFEFESEQMPYQEQTQVGPQSQEATKLLNEEENFVNYDEITSDPDEHATQIQGLNYQELKTYQQHLNQNQAAAKLDDEKLSTKAKIKYESVNPENLTSNNLNSEYQKQHRQAEVEVEKKAEPFYQNISSQIRDIVDKALLITGQKSSYSHHITETGKQPNHPKLTQKQHKSSTPYPITSVGSESIHNEQTIKSKKTTNILTELEVKYGIPKLLNKMEMNVKKFLKSRIDKVLLSFSNVSTNTSKNVSDLEKTKLHKNEQDYEGTAQSPKKNNQSNTNNMSSKLRTRVPNNPVFEEKDVSKLISLIKALSKIEHAVRSGNNETSLYDKYNDFLKLADSSEKSENASNETEGFARRAMNIVNNETVTINSEDDTTEVNSNIDTSEAETIKKNVLDYINI